jgi:YD repeat-containing protein
MCHLLVNKLNLPNSAYITNTFDVLGRWTGTYLKNTQHSTLNSHQYTYDAASRRTKQTRTGGDYVDYTYDRIGQLKTAVGKESGGSINRVHERFGYAYDATTSAHAATSGAISSATSATGNTFWTCWPNCPRASAPACTPTC